MRRLIFLLIVLMLSVWVGLQLTKDPGYVLISFRGWSAEMPLWFAILAIFLFFMVLDLFVRLVNGITGTWGDWNYWLSSRRKKKAYSKMNRGLIELIEGHWKQSEKLLTQSVAQSNAPLLNYLGAAKAAHEQDAFERRDNYLQKAFAVEPKGDIAIGITKANLLFDQGKLAEALDTLNQLRAMDANQPTVLTLLQKVYTHMADWPNLLRLLPIMRKAKVISQEHQYQLETHVYQELLKDTEIKTKNAEAVRQCWDDIPRKNKEAPRLIETYGTILQQYPYTSDEIASLIQSALKSGWDKALVRLYGTLKTSNPQKQLEYAENWLNRYGNHAALFLTLGKICMRCQLWGKARSYFEESLNLEGDPETYAAYGKLLEQLGETHLALENYRDGLAQEKIELPRTTEPRP